MKLSKLSLSLILLFCAPISLASDISQQLDAQQRSMLSLQNQVSSLSRDVEMLRGEVEELRYQLKNANAVNSQANSSTNTNTNNSSANATTNVTSNNSGSNTVVTTTPDNNKSNTANNATQGAKNTLPQASAEAKAMYDAAYAKVTQGKFDEAKKEFTSYIQKYDNNSLTPNAWYWLGQVQYNQNDYDNARVSFLNVARFNDSQKRPDALYKLGMISKARGEKDKAKKYFELVISNYNGDVSANLAKNALDTL